MGGPVQLGLPPMAPQQAPLGGQDLRSQYLAQALAGMSKQPEANASSLGENLLAEALMQTAYQRRQQALNLQTGGGPTGGKSAGPTDFTGADPSQFSAQNGGGWLSKLGGLFGLGGGGGG